MDIKKLQALVVDALEDVKAQEIAVFDTTHLTALFDRLAIVSGTSNRQTKALAASVRDKVKSAGGHVVGMEGEATGEWVLVDLGDMIVHIMQPAIRAYYRLEEIWGDKPLKLADVKRGLKAKGAQSDDEAKPRRRTAVSKTVEVDPADAARLRNITGTRLATTAKDEPAPKRAAPKTAARKAVSKTAVGKTPVGKSAVGKTATKAAPKTAAKKAVSKTTATKTATSKTTGPSTIARKTAGKSAGKSASKTPAGRIVKVAISKSANAKPVRKTTTSR